MNKEEVQLCPNCGMDTLIFEEFEMPHAESGFFKAMCAHCDFSGRQWNVLHFNKWQIEKPNGEYEDMEVIDETRI
jgi:hypothetical protein